jgi:hypothetical protein
MEQYAFVFSNEIQMSYLFPFQQYKYSLRNLYAMNPNEILHDSTLLIVDFRLK